MTLTVKPTVTIDAIDVACTVDRIDAEPVAIRGIEVDWGRSNYHDSSVEPSSATLSITDVTGQWAQRIRAGRAIGTRVEIAWTGTPDRPGTIARAVMFRGRITHATARPMDLHAATGERRWEVKLTCADRTADMGNALAAPEVWPAEDMLDRAVKIRDLGAAAGSGIKNVFFWPGYVGVRAAPLDVKDKTALSLMGDFFRSMGNDSYAYDPDANVVRQAIRLSQKLTVHLGSFDDTLGAVVPVPGDIIVDKVTYPGVALGGCALRGTPEVTADQSTDINRLECSWKDYSTDYGDWTTVRENVKPNDARRVMKWESWLDAGDAIDPTLDNVWRRVREEGARPKHPDLETLPTFTFPTERMARWLLQTWENTRPAFIAGDYAYQWLLGDRRDYMPVVAPIGGVTRFDPEHGWSTHMRVHWIHNESGDAPSVTWAQIRQRRVSMSTPSTPWWYRLIGLPARPPVAVGEWTPERDLSWGEPEPEAGYRFGRSVTWGDMRHVPSTGAEIIDHLE